MQFEVIYRIYLGIHQFLRILSYALYIYALMTWFVRPDAKIYRIFSRFCEPLLAPFRPIGRKLIQMGLRIDLSVWIAAIGLNLLDSIIYRIIFGLLL